jgi:hypothetical protein
MRPALIVVLLATLAPAANAADAPARPPRPPHVFAQAGYAEPAIGPAACHAVNAGEARCMAPPMTAGMYLVQATGVSTATAAGAAQQLTIWVGDQICRSTREPDPKAPWAVGLRRPFTSACLFTIVTDEALPIVVGYVDQNATKDPGGPTVIVTPEPWSGAIEALPVRVPQP